MHGACVRHDCVTGDVSGIPGTSGVSAGKEFTMFQTVALLPFSG